MQDPLRDLWVRLRGIVRVGGSFVCLIGQKQNEAVGRGNAVEALGAVSEKRLRKDTLRVIQPAKEDGQGYFFLFRLST